MLIVAKSLITVLAFFSFLYFFWKKLKDDYSQYQVFTSGFSCLFGLGIGSLVSSLYLPEFLFLTSMIGSLIGLIVSIKRFKMRTFEALEAWIIASLNIVFFQSGFILFKEFSYIELVNLFVTLFLIFLFFFINKRYKRYVWYRSGKVGFSGLLVGGLYMVFRASFLLFSGIMSSRNNWEGVIYAVIAFVIFLNIYNLSQKET